MGRLFWKIFLWFWVTLILIGLTVAWGTAIYLHNSDEFRRPDLRSRFIQQEVKTVRQVLKYGGADAAFHILSQNRRDTPFRSHVYVIDEMGLELLGREISAHQRNIKNHGIITSPIGESFQLLSTYNPVARHNTAEMMMRPFKRNQGVFILWIGIALSLSGLVCFWLAWYLSKPIRSLQKATQYFSQGKLDTRVAHLIDRDDEIGDLGKDFDVMAGRLQSLINNQKQLLSDISHELRSPLARLQLALALARKKLGQEANIEMQRIEHETNRLDDLVGQSLTLSRLDAGAAYPMDDYIDIGQLLEEIIKDCDYEAVLHNKRVNFVYEQSWTINANAELFRRALENVVRNAIYYTDANSSVEVNLSASQYEAGNALIRICDQGPGVSEDKLESLFEPFVRLSSARDRDSGGYGLGLAIAKRSIAFHNGSIKAMNRKPKGLCIDIILPTQD